MNLRKSEAREGDNGAVQGLCRNKKQKMYRKV